MYEQRIEIPNVLYWYKKIWKIILLGVVIVTAIATMGFYLYSKKSYNEEMSKRLTIDQFESIMKEYDCQVAKAVLNIDELLEVKNQRLQDLNEEYEDPSAAGEDALVEKEELIQRIYWLSQLRQMYFIDFSDDQSRYYNLLCGNDYPPLEVPSITKKMIFQSAFLGVIVMLSLGYLTYILGGYLHSYKEIKINFKLCSCAIRKQIDNKKKNLQMLMEINEMDTQKDAAIIDLTGKEDLANKQVIDSVSELLEGKLIKNPLMNAEEQEYIHKHKNVYIIAAVNKTKVMKIKKMQQLCENIGAEIKGIIVITE